MALRGEARCRSTTSSRRRSCAPTSSSTGVSAPSPANSASITPPSSGCCARQGLSASAGARAAPPSSTPYMAFLTETLTRFPTLTAARLFDMAKARGYPGGPDHFRHRIAQLRPRRAREAYLRLRTLPGEQAQVGLGPLRQAHRRTRPTSAHGVCPGAELLAPIRSCAFTSTPRSPTSSAATSRRSPCSGRRQDGVVRQHAQRRARTPRRRHPLPSHAARTRRPLPLRAPSRRPRPRQRERPRRATHPLRARELLPRTALPRPPRPQRPGR